MADPVLQSAAGVPRSWKFAGKTAWGYPFNYLKNVIEHTFGYTHIGKKVSLGAAAAVHASITGSTSAQTITSGISNPDVPRVLAITTGGSGISAGNVVITGTNVEGKTISDTIAMNTSNGQTDGVLVFKTVSSILVPAALGASGTVTIDTTDKIGLVHRLPPSYSTIVCISDTAEEDSTKPVVEAAVSASNVDNEFVEKNWATPATALDGTTFLYFFYWFHKVKVQPLKDSPQFYSTTTSTSTSSTSTSSSTSSTSTSLSTSSTSTSVTTTSTSSTSTSTTTLPV